MATDFGTDIHCVTDFKAHMPVVSGKLCLAQALARRLQTPRGVFPWWPDYGLDVRKYLLSTIDTSEIEGEVQAECEKDERVDSVQVSAIRTESSVSLIVDVTPDDETDPFEFVFIVTADKAELLLTS